jgi:hypothetical protein
VNNAPLIEKLLRKRAIEHYRTTPAKHIVSVQDGSEPLKRALFDFALAHIGNVPIVYLEFGVNRGASMLSMIRKFTHPDSRFFGFDSFVGLPEKWRTMDAGTFSTHGKLPSIKDSRVTFVKGWFQNTLPGFLSDHNFDPNIPVFVNFDADLYSSTLFILAALWPKFNKYFFYFDEFPFDEVVALYDFALSFPVEMEFFACTHRIDLPKQIFGEIKRVALDIK